MTASFETPSVDRGSTPLLPDGRLTIGLTGHRSDRLGRDNAAAVAQALTAAFVLIEDAAASVPRRALRLVTGLADGADSIGADTAGARGWRLDVILPYFREDYAEDFAPGAMRAEFYRRLAACDAVMELSGDRGDPAGDGAAYERAGRLMLAQSDVLLAIWDGDPSRGRGGAPQIVAEAVLQGIPVIHIDPAGRHSPVLLWDGLSELDLGQQTVETVARGAMTDLPRLIGELLDAPGDPDSRKMIDRFQHHRQRRWTAMIAYPLLLALVGVRRFRLADFGSRIDRARQGAPIHALCSSDATFAGQVAAVLAPRFAHADAAATRIAQTFRSSYVANFVLAALAVVLSLLGLALPPSAKPVLIVLEIATIATILIQTRTGNRADWHRRWLDNRALAERLRCLAVSAQLGDLDLRAPGGRAPPWVGWYTRAAARELGLPSGRIDARYLACVRTDLLALVDAQVDYLAVEARRMHLLEHRLHMLGTWLFAATALACVALLGFKGAEAFAAGLHPLAKPFGVAATIVGAALPAVGAAIYGIRMQGDFAGIAERDHQLGEQLASLRGVVAEDELSFDTLSRRARRVTGLLTDDLGSWLQTYHARPLALPG